MDINEVLNKFTECSNSAALTLQYHIPSNGIVEWYGKTIKRKPHLISWLRLEYRQCEISFSNPKTCGPFEHRSTHFESCNQPPENYDDYEFSVVDANLFHTPIPDETLTATKISYNSDDSDDLAFHLRDKEAKTPSKIDCINKLNQSDDSPLALPLESVKKSAKNKNATKRKLNYDTSIANTDDGERLAKRSIYEVTMESPRISDRTEVAETTINNKNKISQFSELKYLEAEGMIKIIRNRKHRGVNGSFTSESVQGELFNLSDESDHSRNGIIMKRPTKLKLSYRIRNDLNTIQFALIIFEHLTKKPTAKRNLLNEFKLTSSLSSASSSPKTPNEKENTSKSRKPTKLKRLRF